MCIPVLVSYASMLTARSDSSLSVRTVEWLRAHGARGLVDTIETFYYTLSAPSKGGPTIKALPHQAGVASSGGSGAGASRAGAASRHPHHPAPVVRPAPIKPVIHPALPGEGRWHATFAAGGRQPPVYITSYRPEPAYPRIVAGLAWIDQARTSIWLYPGIQEPAVAMPSRGPEEVPLDRRHRLVATFNSAFKLADSGGGFASGGRTYAPLKNGYATVLRYRNGRVNIVDWEYGPTAPRNVVYARQNLALLINDGRLNPNLSNGPQWGATLGNSVMVWRSGLGIDRHGNLIYAAADYLTVQSLAEILKHAGAVRAMQLDINAYWPSFITYRYPGARDPANLLPDMQRSPYRYLTPDDRDFFAVYLK
ncbi:MAG TPA: phosphodiester glycosidase family protein [Solirubrobacteraceae bacterium]|nr:phosphodiester glycosidase family protein [Solirubrobacteraceae bacterium]